LKIEFSEIFGSLSEKNVEIERYWEAYWNDESRKKNKNRIFGSLSEKNVEIEPYWEAYWNAESKKKNRIFGSVSEI
jgi:hypothetical protein